MDIEINDRTDQSICESIHIEKETYIIDGNINHGMIGHSNAIPQLWKSCIYRIPLESNTAWWYRIFSTIIGGQVAYLAVNPFTEFAGGAWESTATLSSGNAKFRMDDEMLAQLKKYMLTACPQYSDRIELAGIWDCATNSPINLPESVHELSPPFALSPGVPDKWKGLMRPNPEGINENGPAGLSINEDEYGGATSDSMYGKRGYYENYGKWNNLIVSQMSGEDPIQGAKNYDTFYAPITSSAFIIDDLRTHWFEQLSKYTDYNHLTQPVADEYAKAICNIYADSPSDISRAEGRGYVECSPDPRAVW